MTRSRPGLVARSPRALVVVCLVFSAVSAIHGFDVAAVEDRRPLAGRVVDAETGEPVPFASIGVPGAAAGTVGAEDGSFVLERATAGAVVVFAALGYRSREIPAEQVAADGTVEMTPVEIEVQETVSVTAEDPGEPTVFGKKLELPGYGFGFGSSFLGAEIGARIRIDGPTYLESAHFLVAHTAGERFLYRVNVYDLTGGEIGRNLLTENVIIAAKQERGTLSVDLREHRLVVNNDVLLGLEWVQDDEGAGNANVMFRAKPRTKTMLYLRLTSQMPFRTVPRHAVSFYFEGYSLE